MIELYQVACGALLVGSVAARGLPIERTSFDEDYEDGWDLTPRELAYLRRGPYGVVLTVLAELHGAGSVDLTDPRVARQLDPPQDYDDHLVTAVYAGLNWVRRPRLVALLPSVRRACGPPMRDDLRQRSLLAPLRRCLFARVLLAYAVALAVATMVERSAQGATVATVVVVAALAFAASVGRQRTVAGMRELQQHNRALGAAIDDGADEAAYLADLVARHGQAAVEVLCGTLIAGSGYITVGGLAPRDEPTAEPAPVRIPAPRLVELPAGWRRPIYESPSDGPAIVVRHAFAAAGDRVAA